MEVKRRIRLEYARNIYVIYNPELNITKVGISEDVNKRKRVLETESGCNLLLHYISPLLTDAREMEMAVHKVLFKKRKIGEWFHVTPVEAEAAVKDIIVAAKIDPIVLAYQGGETISKIARDHGVSRTAILKRLAKAMVYDKDRKEIKKKLTAPKWVDELIDNGLHSMIEEKETPVNNTNHTILLDDDIKKEPGGRWVRTEKNINFNGEVYQGIVFKDKRFTTVYSANIQKVREYLKSL
jgi:transposase-like protein